MNENLWKSRWSNDQIRAMLVEQFDAFVQKDTGVERSKLKELQQAAQLPHAVIVSGLRRVGKSTLLAQMAHQLGTDQFYYVNFEDDRLLGFQAQDANDLYQMLVETFGERRIFIMDEIQNISGWEHFVRRFMDMGFKFYISGSNASLLSRELGTRLTGRYVQVELFPFSFREYLLFRGEEIPNVRRLTTAARSKLNNALNEYLLLGGIPDALKYPELPLLRSLFDDVLYRDIAARYQLDAVIALKELAFTLISNPAGAVSYNKLKEQLRLGSVNTVSSYVEYMQNSWLLFVLNLFSFSVKRQQIAPKKIYCIDNGLVNTVGFRFSPNTGKLLENLIFLTLRQQHNSVYYLQTPTKYEVDFYLPEQRLLIQSAQRIDSASTREREFRAMEDAMREVQVEQALILSEKNEADVSIGGVKVKIQSIAGWLLNQGV
jgi:predicted AAA+ superfamily ATPase